MIILTCERATPAVPRRYRPLFRGRAALLASHHGYDAGAASLAHRLARYLKAPLLTAGVSRLLVDANRSLRHPALHDAAVRALPRGERVEIVKRYYEPLRDATLRLVTSAVARGQTVLHLSVHSFTPSLAGRVRRADFGILYDPRRRGEAHLATELAREIDLRLLHFRVRKNYPYRGTADGHTTALRRRFGAREYLGVELELNQRWASPVELRRIAAAIAESLACCPTAITAAPGSQSPLPRVAEAQGRNRHSAFARRLSRDTT